MAVFAASSTLGAQCAFLIQALHHELSHMTNKVQTWDATILRKLSFSVCATGSALGHVPWIAYYFGPGHERHHRLAGSPKDADADALFYLWSPPYQGIFPRLCWLSVAAVCVPVAYLASLTRDVRLDWKTNAEESKLVILNGVSTGFAYYMLGRVAATYCFLSSCFSMGLLCHPLVGFWLVQHLCVGGKQPTVSYNGSWLWNILTLNELLHIEHHDMSSLCWMHLPKLRQLAPQHYSYLHYEESIAQLLLSWLRNDTEKVQFDFACRSTWHTMDSDLRMISLEPQERTRAVSSAVAAMQQEKRAQTLFRRVEEPSQFEFQASSAVPIPLPKGDFGTVPVADEPEQAVVL